MSKKLPDPIEISVAPLTNTNSVILTYLQREKIFMSPDYQRPGNIWSLEKKQLLIDSIVNRFDVPKLYFHEYPEPRLLEGKKRKYAVVDGKQRLLAVWEFINNEFPLADRFEYLSDPALDLSGLTYKELAESHPEVKAMFDNYPLAISVVRTDDSELIEDMFSRLNEAVPLNAAEKRNAFGGPIPPLIRKLAKEPFFESKLPFKNSRYRHFDVACKFLYLSKVGSPTDTKKIKLDEFVKKSHDSNNPKAALRLFEEAVAVSNTMNKVFINQDKLLKNIGTLTAYFLIFHTADRNKELKKLNRKRLVEFEEKRDQNSKIAAEDITKAEYDFLKFDELTASVNDEYALRFRCRLISQWVFGANSQTTATFSEKV